MHSCVEPTLVPLSSSVRGNMSRADVPSCVETTFNMSPEERKRHKYQLLLVVTSGPRQYLDVESFLDSIAEESEVLATCVPRLIIRNSSTPIVLWAEVLNSPTGQPDGDTLRRFTGVSRYVYDQLRHFKGVDVPASSLVYFPPQNPASGEALF